MLTITAKAADKAKALFKEKGFAFEEQPGAEEVKVAFEQ